MRSEIETQLLSGLSERKVAAALGLPHCEVRKVAVKLRGVRSSTSTCRICGGDLTPEELATARKRSIYICRSCSRERQVPFDLAKFGLTVEQYNELLRRQGNSCAICRSPFGHVSKTGKQARLAIDHDHRTGKVRGLLCNSCNRGLGYLGDSSDILRSALHYLEDTQ